MSISNILKICPTTHNAHLKVVHMLYSEYLLCVEDHKRFYDSQFDIQVKGQGHRYMYMKSGCIDCTFYTKYMTHSFPEVCR